MERNRTRRAAVPSYRRQRRKNGIDLAFVEINGQRYYLGAHGAAASREKYYRLIAEWEASGRAGPVRPEEVTVVELANQFVKWAESYYLKHGKPTAEPGNIKLAVRPLLKLYGRTNAAAFGPRALKAVRQEMVDEGWVRKHINRQTDRIKRMFKWAVAEELVPPGVYEGLRAVTGLKYGRCGALDNPPVQPVPEELIEPVKRHVSRQVAAMIDLQLLTGARPGEVVQIRPCDIDRDGPTWTYRPAEHKTQHHGHERVIFLGPKAQRVLRPFLLRPRSAYCFSPAEAEQERRDALTASTPNGGRRVGANRRTHARRKPGTHYTRDSYRRAIDRGLEQAFAPPGDLAKRRGETRIEYRARLTDKQKSELKEWRRAHHWHPHQLRHNYATNVRREFGLEAAQVLLGHTKADVTQIYAERDMTRAATVAAKIG